MQIYYSLVSYSLVSMVMDTTLAQHFQSRDMGLQSSEVHSVLLRHPRDPMHQDFCPGAGEAAAAPDCRAPVRFMARKGCAAAAATSRRSACLYARHLHATRSLDSPITRAEGQPLLISPIDALPKLYIMSSWKDDSSCSVRLVAALSFRSIAVLQRLPPGCTACHLPCRCA